MSDTVTKSQRTISRNLRYDFTDAELRGLAEEMAKAHDEVAQGEARLKSATTTIKAEIAGADARLAAAAGKLKSRHEYRETECIEVRDYQENLFIVIRTDTDELVESRPLKAEERQPPLNM